MPVTARLSQKFYQTFGDELTNELVEWFNQVDAQGKSELRDLADVYYGRFRAELRSELAGLRVELLKWMFLYWAGTALTVIGLLKL